MNSEIHQLSLGTMDNFIHIIVDKATGQATVVDPGWNADFIADYCLARDYQLTGILLTHSHHDHISAVQPLIARFNLPVYISREEFRIGLARMESPQFIADGDVIPLGESRIQVVATPGHTIGSVSYWVDKHLIVGDTLFVDGCGRCNFIESDVNQMWDTMQRLKQLPDDTIIYCGHNYGQQKTDTLGNQKKTNPYLLIDDKDFFINFRMELQSKYRSIPFMPSSAAEMADIYQRHY